MMKTINTTSALVSVHEEGESFNGLFGPCERREFSNLLTCEFMEQGCDYEVHLYYRITADGYIQLTSYANAGSNSETVESQYKTDGSLSLRDNLILAYKRRTRHRMHFQGLGWIKETEADLLEPEEVQKVHEELIAIAETPPESEFLKFVERSGSTLTCLDPEDGLWKASCPGGRHDLQIQDHKELWFCGYCNKGGGRQELTEFVRVVQEKKTEASMTAR